MAVRKKPYTVQILAFEGATPIVPVGLFDLLRKANGLAEQMGVVAPMDVQLVAASNKLNIRAAGDLPLRCHGSIADAPSADLVVASPMDPEVLDLNSRRPATVDFIRRAHASGSVVASACTGAFALGEAGLLDGQRATTHWAFFDLFSRRFPSVRLDRQATLVDNRRVVTAGGATSFLNLALHIVEQRFGREVARQAARMFLIDERKAPQGSYAQFNQQRVCNDEQIARAQDWIERRGPAYVTVERLASEVAMTRRTLIRRFKTATGLTPIEYLQRARIDLAKRLLENTARSVSEVAEEVGYQEQAAFRRLFIRHAGLTPSEYRRRHVG